MNIKKTLEIIRSRKNPVIFDRKNRFIYFPNNKVAQVSIVRGALGDRSIIWKDDQKKWERKMARLNPKRFEHVFTFAIVRNPFDRAVSAFKYLQLKGVVETKLEFRKFCYDILRIQGTSFNPHFDIQSDGLFCDGFPIPKFIARFEKIEQDWQIISKAIKGPQELPHQNKSKRKKDYAEYYDDFSKELISTLYAEDLKNFYYEF